MRQVVLGIKGAARYPYHSLPLAYIAWLCSAACLSATKRATKNAYIRQRSGHSVQLNLLASEQTLLHAFDLKTRCMVVTDSGHRFWLVFGRVSGAL
jgi:hypothetical protein